MERTIYKAFVLQLLYMETILANLRIRKDVLKELDVIVKEGFYASRSELIREAIRKEITRYKEGLLVKSIRKNIDDNVPELREATNGDLAERIGKDVWDQLHHNKSSGVT